MNSKFLLLPLTLTLIIGFSTSIAAKVLNVKFQSKEIILDGKEFGEYGSYELLKGKIYFGFSADNYFNNPITDIEFAPINAQGQVEAWGNIVVMQPSDPSKRSGTAMVEVSNRGGKFSPAYFNQATKSRELDPNDPEYWGDGMLMEQGLTIIWIGWQFDLPTQENILKLNVPYAQNRDGSTIKGMVRSDWTVDAPRKTLTLAHRSEDGYPAINLESDIHQLTVRNGRDAPRRQVPRRQWQFLKMENGSRILSSRHISLDGGFQEGKIYELVYQAQNPPIVGLGLTAIRDVISYAKYEEDCAFKVEKGIAVGVSQTGRFLRQFLYQGFNFDEVGRKAFDGMMVITAGAGRGSFNHRFGQPSRDGHRYSAFFYPTDIFPFTGGLQSNGKESDALYKHEMTKENPPKIFYINTGYEYWGRAASLIHTNVEGTADFPHTDFDRIYHLASAQHFVESFPPNPNSEIKHRQFRGNHLEMKVNYRALLVKLLEWVKENKTPPASRYPTLKEGTLIEKEVLAMPQIPDLQLPTTIHNAYRTNYGEGWKGGFIANQPPILGKMYQSLVSQVDALGNEMGGVKNVEIRVPLATYTPWNIRHGFKGGYHELTNFRGTFIPLPANDLEKMKNQDPRPSVTSLYSDKGDFIKKVENAAEEMVFEGFLLERDIPYILQRNGEYWDWIMADKRKMAATTGPKNGTLMLMGGGQLDPAFYEKFKELVGADNAKIVIIPTASESASTKNFQKNLIAKFKTFGFKKVSILHAKNRKEADSNGFAKSLNNVEGVWFTGGRQWRLADAYLNTKTIAALQGVLDRGGVIAGTSAGATILGSYLARGDTYGNKVMMGDHEAGFGFLSNTAIDQHLLTRNRQFDMPEIIAAKPSLLGIGLDENTGILVTGNSFEVMGKSYVAIYDGTQWNGDFEAAYGIGKTSERFYFLKAGEKYDLKERKRK
ncbi:MAG: cyanophycinase [Paraglaciecola sp.]|jgi:cyanophycinase